MNMYTLVASLALLVSLVWTSHHQNAECKWRIDDKCVCGFYSEPVYGEEPVESIYIDHVDPPLIDYVRLAVTHRT